MLEITQCVVATVYPETQNLVADIRLCAITTAEQCDEANQVLSHACSQAF